MSEHLYIHMWRQVREGRRKLRPPGPWTPACFQSPTIGPADLDVGPHACRDKGQEAAVFRVPLAAIEQVNPGPPRRAGCSARRM